MNIFALSAIEFIHQSKELRPCWKKFLIQYKNSKTPRQSLLFNLVKNRDQVIHCIRLISGIEITSLKVHQNPTVLIF